MQVGLNFGHPISLSTANVSALLAQAPGSRFSLGTVNHNRQISMFTEDEILATEQRVEILIKAMPRTPEGIEAWMHH